MKEASLIAKIPMLKWSGSTKGLISFDKNKFELNFSIKNECEVLLYQFTKKICEFRLHYFFNEEKN
ncbi:hypothetical protein JOC86_000096 [Bacillus pakistanensis]|uniref:Uncharacterized protein n=1 Tax=Rossellomorea pakistanensis TaxID=992288 RepID=A0ABS2N6W6_9BACI|nr:hypothetical protein [Bacillus pakistanensis]